MATVPVVALGLGSVAGLGAARLVASHFSRHGQADLGGVRRRPAGGRAAGRAAHQAGARRLGNPARGCGAVDHAVDTEDEAFAAARRFLSYLPSSVWDLPPRSRGWDDPARREEALLSVVPRDKRRPYHMRRIIDAVVDQDSFFELGRLFGRPIITGLARLDGWPVALMAGDPLFDGGAWNADACQKIIRFVDLAETFHLPVVHLADCPGFQVGLAAESSAVIRWGVRAIAAINQSRMPWCSIAGAQLSTASAGWGISRGRGCALRYAWPSASWGSLPLEGGIEAAYRADIDEAGRSRRQAGGDRGAAEPAALAVPHRRVVLGGGYHRPARHPAPAVRFRQSGRAVARSRGSPLHHASMTAAHIGPRQPAPGARRGMVACRARNYASVRA